MINFCSVTYSSNCTSLLNLTGLLQLRQFNFSDFLFFCGFFCLFTLSYFRPVCFKGTWTQADRLGEKMFVVGRPFQKTRGYTRDCLVSASFEAVREALFSQEYVTWMQFINTWVSTAENSYAAVTVVSPCR